MTPDGVFEAEVEERSFRFEFEEGRLTIDGAEVEYAFEPLESGGDGGYVLHVDDRSYPVVVEEQAGGALRVSVAGRARTVRVKDEHDLLLERFGLKEAGADAERTIQAPMPGLVLEVNVEEGDAVEAGDALLVLEAMKMENELQAPVDGTVKAIHVEADDTVDKNALLVELE
jgi:pyruvate carboxylase subunit B